MFACFISDSPTKIACAPQRGKAFDIRAGMNAAFGHQQFFRPAGALAQLRRQTFRRAQIHLEGFQIAIVHADELCAAASARSNSASSCTSTNAAKPASMASV